jgi:hypothetical protein
MWQQGFRIMCTPCISSITKLNQSHSVYQSLELGSMWWACMCAAQPWCFTSKLPPKTGAHLIFQPSGPNLRLSCTTAWNRHSPNSRRLQASGLLLVAR